MSGRIAVGVDGSEESAAAVDWAADEAALRGAELRLVNASLWQEHALVAVQPARDVRAQRARDLLAAMKERARARQGGVTTSEEEVEDAPATVLVSASAGAELVVLGSYGLGASVGFTAGSVGQEVAAEAHGPVVLVRGTRADPGGRVVVGVDLRSAGEELLRFAFEFAARRSAPLRVVHTWHLTPVHHALHPHEEESTEAARTALSEAVRPHRERFPQLEVEEEAAVGRAAGHLVEAAEGAGIVVVGRRTTARRGHLGATAHAVIHHAACPVAVVPHT
ncbi:universal stress protein [Streptomyces sanyensis]|uniref:universal stress protein n=1 Tax=Streptomyces sanyensis TaxID=568869 RepID=UPI003D76DC3F